MHFLEVPFREKDEAKLLGARWDAASKKWYVPTELSEQLELFKKWLPGQDRVAGPSDFNNADNRSEQLNFDQGSDQKVKGIQLSELLRKVQNALRQGVPGATWVVAEIANLNSRRGHVYLELTESNTQGQAIANCRAMIWQSQAAALLQRFETETGCPLAVGQKILILAEVSFHEQYGFSMVIQDVDSSYTLGELEQNLNNLRKQLVSEGLYQQNKQFALPTDYFRVAVIAPPEAAGLGDFRADADNLQTAGLCQFQYFYSAFQGEAVQKEMLSAFQAVQALHQSNPFDVLVIIRGGGAKLDLNMLNLYPIAKLLCEAKLPVLTGIGHERDNTILDEVAHTRFDTPSKVIGYIRHEIFQQAQTAQAHWKQIEHSSRLSVKYLEQDLNQFNQSITHNSQIVLSRWKQFIEPLKFEVQRLSEGRIQSENRKIQELKFAIDGQLKNRIALKKQSLEQIKSQADADAKRVLIQKQDQITQWIALILSSGPKTQLNRGFNIAKDPLTNKPVTTAEQALQTKNVQLQFVDGSVSAQIDQEKGLIDEQ